MNHDTIRDYLAGLQINLDFNKNRLEAADPKDVPAIQRSIETLENEIKKYTAMLHK